MLGIASTCKTSFAMDPVRDLFDRRSRRRDRSDDGILTEQKRVRLTYFTNRYPAISHTFIRREIAALEARGVTIDRVALRADPLDQLVDAEDRREYARTDVLLAKGRLALLAAVIAAAMTTPLRSARVLLFALGLGCRSGIPIAKMLAYWAEAALLRRCTLASGSDLIRVHFGTNCAIVARLAHRLGAPPFCIAYHGPDEFDAPERWNIRGTVAEARFVTAISSFCAAQLMRWSDVADWPRIHQVRCIVDTAQFNVAPMPGGPFRLCTIARIAPQKGLPLLLDALAQLSHPPGLDIVGDGPGRPALEAQAAQLGLGDQVRFLGSRDGAGVRAALAAAHVFILPSFAEGLPVVIMEALASGRPVIASAIAGTGELVDAGCGWLVPAGDVAGLAATIALARDTDLAALAALGAHGRERVCERHAAADVAQNLMDAWSRSAKTAAPLRVS